MSRYILRRVLVSIPVLFGITIIIFILINVAPGDPVTGQIDPTMGDFSPEFVESERERLGLNEPLVVQYVLWLGRVVRGDLGFSLITRKPVTELISERIWPTTQLALTALTLSVVVGITIGVISAVKQYSWIDYVATFFSFAFVSVPGFFLALGLIFFFSLRLQWLPTSGIRTLGQEPSLWDSIKHMILPVIVLGIGSAAPLVRYTRSSMLEVLRQDYITVARAKGVRRWSVILRHAFPNTLIPLITVIGLRLPFLFEGSVIIEQIFNWPGMGTLNIDAVLNQDYTVLMGLNMIVGFMVLISNLLADIAYAFVDPRIRYD